MFYDPGITTTKIAKIEAFLRLLRPHQWVKNGFVVAPLFFTPPAVNLHSTALVLLGFLIFCAVSSGIYALNDLCDRHVDRLHPRKKNRPLASGLISPKEAAITSILLITSGVAAAVVLSPRVALVIAAYAVINIAYCWKLKTVSIVDILVIATGFVLRLDAGAILIGVEPSAYLVTCTGLIALFIALAKRRDDLVKRVDPEHRQSLTGYTPQFLDISMAIVLGALLVSYLIYTMDAAVMQRFGTDKLYLTLPFVLAGVLRYLQITLVEEQSGSPIRVLVSDRFMIVAALGWLAVFATLIYV
jgi:decaprenyl-phosphate phosphoribosyltransferase